MFIKTNVNYFLKESSMDLIESKTYHSSSSFQEEIPGLLTIVQDDIETVIPSESNEHLSVKKTKIASCELNY
jgi:hypothetical protein